MKRRFKRIAALLAAILIFSMSLPFEVFAVDPVSGTVIANAFAQAVAAYGAAHGVSMGFDVANADQIGEGVHDLWDQYVQDVQDENVPVYNTVSANFWAYGYKKIGDYVGVDLGSEMVEALDGFWNWLLSGPAEMVKVDNAYQWSSSPSGDYLDPVIYYSSTSSLVPFVDSSSSGRVKFDSGIKVFSLVNSRGTWIYSCYTTTSGAEVAAGWVGNYLTFVSSTENAHISCTSTLNGSVANVDNTVVGYCSVAVDGYPGYYKYTYSGSASGKTKLIPTYSTIGDILGDAVPNSSISLSPYGSDYNPVAIPDNTDVNYSPLPTGIPLDISWDPSRYGTGDLPLTDAQKQAIEGDVTDSIEEEGSLTLEEETTDDPSTDDPSEEIGELDDYTVAGLADVFPFCIPFDIYNFLSALVATPTPPHFTATLQFPQAIGGSQTIDLDFDTPTFNQLAQLLRLLELLAFIVGLALLTRSMFLRG